ncbi:MAG: hypothetical protein QNK19_08480 [Xanthomonadales bacterium]|nr:hypothetical protein [Xanthomonadales bacterium]
MNTIHNNGENDKSLDDGLGKLSNAYGQLQHEEPPELLDQAILNSAHRAIEKKPHWMQFGWLHGLTTAAVFVLALSLIFNTREPMPDYESGMRLNEANGLQREKAARKQSPDVQSDDLGKEMKEESEKRQDVVHGGPVSAVQQSAPMEITAGDQAAEPVADAQSSTYVQEKVREGETGNPSRSQPGLTGTGREAGPGHDRQAKTDSYDKDVSHNEPVFEEMQLPEAVSIDETRERDAISKKSRPAAAAITSLTETEAPAETDPDIEQRLLEIISLKQSGDETWSEQLELFRQDHPDYPLPEELLN